MSFDHWWIGFFADESEYEILKPEFAGAAEKAVLSPKSYRALEAWRHRPSDFEQGSPMNDEAFAQLNAFIWAFNLPGFDQLAEQLVTTNKFPGFAFAAEDRLFRLAITARNTPVSILWHALGFERASQLPGQMGNMLLHPRDIENAREKTRRVYAGISPHDLLDAAKRYCGWDASDDRMREVISFLPDGLERAKELRTGFLALARAQL